MNDELMILSIITAIVIIQIVVSAYTVLKLMVFKNIFPSIADFKTRTVYIPASKIQNIKPATILANPRLYARGINSDETEIMLIYTVNPQGTVLTGILDAINTYLIRNKGAVSDFNLMKDIVERNCEAVDEDINTSLPIPLYLGLMGTMLGIVVGLYFINADSFTSETPLNAIAGLIGGVRIAMISSFIGLLLTTVGQGGLYKRIKTKVESKKHAFYTFLQTELLPVLNKNVNATIYELQRNLTDFNETFSVNANRFGAFLDSIHSSFESQTEFLRLIKEINITQMAKANVSVLRELKESIGEIGKFRFYLNQINAFIGNAEKLNAGLLAQIERTNSVETVVAKIQSIVEQNKTLMDFLNSHFATLDQHSQLVNNAIIDTDNSLKKGVESFEQFTTGRLAALREFVITEEFKMRERLSESGLLEELKNLSNVKASMANLETLATAQQILMQAQNEKLDNLIKSIYDLTGVLKSQKHSGPVFQEVSHPEQNENGKDKLAKHKKYLIWAGITALFILYTVIIIISLTAKTT
ncbi:MAG: hypothetical protein LBR10_15025 [Prevotellaceae bacterium]|jgi:hypothetical protein|nr:hypothetical protein [Prevotellaceae bacterium]